mmetsp:Transcript_46250/g.128703  ORF Transcript_46250/g.128703 Transcript_46250/m.128703 type:complete len:105 (-) Transcript_46250:20-334(-)
MPMMVFYLSIMMNFLANKPSTWPHIWLFMELKFEMRAELNGLVPDALKVWLFGLDGMLVCVGKACDVDNPLATVMRVDGYELNNGVEYAAVVVGGVVPTDCKEA